MRSRLSSCVTIDAIALSLFYNAPARSHLPPSALKESDRSISFPRASNYYQRIDNALAF
ncbi:hypothetical protein H6F74_09515 [Trichocoleus sp. FACHB-90]|uniref:hypothetical protein n=1 Tax=Cyanophyceae TaxID=3028117 RepID=UPI00168934D6|nr:hypothetical protein [Trichocoleus sp. FACHB-90]MBD1926481.1 hypothetical protein [Trichocoleus sp. FACHB-90]